MRDLTCCFTGHRRLPPFEVEELEARLERTLRRLIRDGFTYFGAGGAVGFDMLAAKTVLRLREEFAHIRLILVLPCENQTDGWSVADKAEYERIRCAADKVVCLEKTYTDDCMKRRNRHLVDHSAVCVCYFKEYGGGTGYTVQYAEKQGVEVINIA